MSKGLKKVLKKVFVSDMQEQLAVADAKLGSAIKVEKCTDIELNIKPISSSLLAGKVKH